jgi:hypothetical protein
MKLLSPLPVLWTLQADLGEDVAETPGAPGRDNDFCPFARRLNAECHYELTRSARTSNWQ